jgi:ribosomal protein S18 acetylase RimI-like enzyme
MINIREIKEKDWIEIKKMMADLHKYESQYDPRYSVDKETGEILGKWIDSELKNKKGIIFIAEENKELLGFACGWIDKKSIHLYTEKAEGYFCDLYVKENHRGKGVGKRLAEALMDFFKKNKVKFVTVETHARNETSQKLYKSLGFKKVTINLLSDISSVRLTDNYFK